MHELRGKGWALREHRRRSRSRRCHESHDTDVARRRERSRGRRVGRWLPRETGPRARRGTAGPPSRRCLRQRSPILRSGFWCVALGACAGGIRDNRARTPVSERRLRVALDLEGDEFRVRTDLDDRRLRPSAIEELVGVADDFTVECLALEGMKPLGVVGAGAARRSPYFHITAVREDGIGRFACL